MSRHALYARPRDLDEAAQLLGALDSGVTLIAGGQELMPHINYGRLAPNVLVDITGLAALRGIRIDEGGVSIGALTVHSDLIGDPVVGAHLPLLAHAASQIGGGCQVQNQGTIGGNIVAQHPLYDVVPPLLALNAAVEIRDGDETRRVALAGLIAGSVHGLGATAILSRVIVPLQGGHGRWGYEKLKITEGAYATANAAVVLTLDEGNRIATLAAVIGAVSELPLDASDVLQGLIGHTWNERMADEVEAVCASAVTKPLSDQQGRGDYRRAMAGVVARRAVAAAFERASA